MSERYHLYIDDSGTRYPDKQQLGREDGMDHFALGGILVKDSEKEEILAKYKDFCSLWDINYPLHSTKIRGMRDSFAWLEQSTKQKEKFLESLTVFLTSLPVIGFAAVICRPGYKRRYEGKHKEPWWMCKTAFTILVERSVKYLLTKDAQLTIKYEEVGTKENEAIERYLKELKNNGSPFNPDTSAKYGALTSEDYKKVVLGDPRRGTKSNAFLQIADLYLYPMVKRRYDENYRAWVELYKNGKVIDCFLSKEDLDTLGIKYSCFDSVTDAQIAKDSE